MGLRNSKRKASQKKSLNSSGRLQKKIDASQKAFELYFGKQNLQLTADVNKTGLSQISRESAKINKTPQ